MKPTKIAAAAIVAAAVLGGCQTPVQRQSFAEMTFTNLAPIEVNVAEIEIENIHKAKAGANHVETRFPVSPSKALASWARDRLRPVGGAGSGKLRLIITDGGVVETALRKDKSVAGVFTKQQSHRYDLSAGGRLEVYDAGGERRGFSTAKATRSITTREDINLNEREKIWYDATEKLMADFNRVMEANIRGYLSDWIR